MSVGARDKVLTAFKEDPDVKVLLISLKAGGVALNLTHANHIFLMGTYVFEMESAFEWREGLLLLVDLYFCFQLFS